MTSGDRVAGAGSGRKRLGLLIAAAAILIGAAIGLSAKNAIWEGWLIDRLFQLRSLASKQETRSDWPVIVVGLDQTSLDSEKLSALPRVLMTPPMAEAGQGVLDAGALAVGYDFIFAYSAEGIPHPDTGELLLSGFDTPLKAFLYRNRGKVFIAHAENGVPHRSFSGVAGPKGVRSVIISPDPDGVVRRHEPVASLEESPFLIDAMLAASGADVDQSYIPLPASRLASSVPYLSLVDVLGMLESPDGLEILKSHVSGRIVLFGGLIPTEDHHAYSDRFLPRLPPDFAETGSSGRPQFRSKSTAGVLMLADFIDAGLTGRFAVDPPMGVVLTAASVFAFLGALAGLLLPLLTLPLVAVVGVLTGLGVSLFGLDFGVLVPPAVAPVACVGAMVIASVGKVGILQRRERSLMRLFGHYMAPDVIRQMAHSEELPQLGGETRHVVVAFIDIVGFTKMSESLEDQEVVRVVNTCFDAIGTVITRHQGYIDKYIGDAIMAVWNAPNTVDNPEKASVDASMEIIALLENMRDATGQQELDLRIALNAGPVLVGDIGGEHRRSFTVMGTTVNTASRIESVAKEKHVRLALSQSVAGGVPGFYALKEIWAGHLRGLSQEMTVYTLDSPETYMEAAKPVTGRAEKPRNSKLLTFPKR